VTGARPDLRTDLYQLGVVFWEGLAFRSLFTGGYAALSRILTDRIPPISELRPELAALDPILERALARERSARYRCAEVFAQDLRRAAARLGGVAEPEEVAEMLASLGGDTLSKRRMRLAVAVGALRTEDSGLRYGRSGIRPRPRRPAGEPLELPSFDALRSSDLFPVGPSDGPTRLDGMPAAARKLWASETVRAATAGALVVLVAAILLFAFA
jgi:hypothetical protein